MPVPTIQQLEKTEGSLKKAVAGQGESTDAAKRRATKKKLRRTQRKRRRFVAFETAKAAAEAKAKAKPAVEDTKSADAAPTAEEPKEATKGE